MQRRKKLGSIATLKVFVHITEKTQTVPLLSKRYRFFQIISNFPDGFKTVQIFPDDFPLSGRFQNCPDLGHWYSRQIDPPRSLLTEKSEMRFKEIVLLPSPKLNNRFRKWPQRHLATISFGFLNLWGCDSSARGGGGRCWIRVRATQCSPVEPSQLKY